MKLFMGESIKTAKVTKAPKRARRMSAKIARRWLRRNAWAIASGFKRTKTGEKELSKSFLRRVELCRWIVNNS